MWSVSVEHYAFCIFFQGNEFGLFMRFTVANADSDSFIFCSPRLAIGDNNVATKKHNLKASC